MNEITILIIFTKSSSEMEQDQKIKTIFHKYERFNASYERSRWSEQTSYHQSFLKFFKYNRKFTNYIRIHAICSSDKNRIDPSLLIRASKRLRSKHLGTLSTDLPWRSQEKSQVDKIIKNFSNIKALNLSHSNVLSLAQKNCKEWLKRAKCLKKLKAYLSTKRENDLGETDGSQSFIKLARIFKKGRLHELILGGKSEELFTMHAHHFPKIRVLRFEGASYLEERRGSTKYIKWKFSYQETADHLKQPVNDNIGPGLEYEEIKSEDWERAKNEEYYKKTKQELETTIKHFKLCWKYENYQRTTCAPILLKEIRNRWQQFGKVVRLPSNFNLQDHNLQINIPCRQSFLHEAHNLTSLNIDYVNQPQIILQIIQSFPDIPNLITLSVQSHKDSFQQECPLLYPLLEAPKNLAKLHLNLENCIGAFKYLEDFPKNHTLKDFRMIVPLKDEAHLKILGGIVNHLQHAETLDIRSNDCTVLSTSQEFYNLFDKAFALPKLKRLGLSFEWLHRTGNELDYVSPYDLKLVNYGSLLKNLLTKEIALEEFRFKFPIKHSSIRKAFLFEILELGFDLKELRLGVGDANLEEFQVSQVLTFLKKMKKLEILRFYDFVIPSNKTMVELADTVSSIKPLRRLQLHSICGDIDLQLFAIHVPKILVKNNLKEATILIPKHFDIDFILRAIKATQFYEDNQSRLDTQRLEDFLKGKSFSPSSRS